MEEFAYPLIDVIVILGLGYFFSLVAGLDMLNQSSECANAFYRRNSYLLSSKNLDDMQFNNSRGNVDPHKDDDEDSSVHTMKFEDEKKRGEETGLI